jgi:hypothetical protein
MNLEFSRKVDYLYLKRLIVLETISNPVLQFCLANVKFITVSALVYCKLVLKAL